MKHIPFKGYIWQVGFGENINVWINCWLSTNSKPFQSQYSQLLPLDAIVKNYFILLLEHEMEISSEIFSHLKLLSGSSRFLFISGQLINLFGVQINWACIPKISFHYIWSQYVEMVVLVLHTHCPIVFWQKFWHLPLPNKIKTFTWQACTNSLPAKVSLWARGVMADEL